MTEIGKLEVGGKFILGMVHCLPLPGTLHYGGSMRPIIEQAVSDAKTLEAAGVDGIIVENMGDAPFAEKLETEQATALSAIAGIVRESVDLPIGIDAAMNDYRTAIALAYAIGADFVRIQIFVDSLQLPGYGVIEPAAHNAVAYRRELGAEDIKIFADVQVKHTHPLLPHVTIEESAHEAEEAGADAVIVTGSVTGQETPVDLIKRVRKVVSVPVIAGSGVSVSNIAEQVTLADGVIVGSGLKEDGVLTNPISYELTRALVDARGKE